MVEELLMLALDVCEKIWAIQEKTKGLNESLENAVNDIAAYCKKKRSDPNFSVNMAEAISRTKEILNDLEKLAQGL
jgi:hypothetical protein